MRINVLQLKHELFGGKEPQFTSYQFYVVSHSVKPGKYNSDDFNCVICSY